MADLQSACREAGKGKAPRQRRSASRRRRRRRQAAAPPPRRPRRACRDADRRCRPRPPTPAPRRRTPHPRRAAQAADRRDVTEPARRAGQGRDAEPPEGRARTRRRPRRRRPSSRRPRRPRPSRRSSTTCSATRRPGRSAAARWSCWRVSPAIIAARRRKTTKFEDSIISGTDIKTNTVFGSTGGGVVNTGDNSLASDFSREGLGNIDTDEVDPIAEAEVYLAYGRDAQAEEILKDALKKDSQRQEIYLKLLEIHAQHNKPSAFETVASELYSVSGGQGETWQKAMALGRQLDPSNPLFGEAGAAAAFAAGAAAATPGRETPSDTEVFAVPPEHKPEASGASSWISRSTRRFRLSPSSGAAEAKSPAEILAGAAHEVAKSSRAVTETAKSVFDTSVTTITGGAAAIAANAAPLAKTAAAKPASDLHETVSFEPESVPKFDLDFHLDEPRRLPPMLEAQSRSGRRRGETRRMPEPAFAMAAAAHRRRNWRVPPRRSSSTSSTSPSIPQRSTFEDPTPSVLDGQWHDAATKLDLAKAYQEMGDVEGAREILQEVLHEGDDQQKAEAQALMAKLGVSSATVRKGRRLSRAAVFVFGASMTYAHRTRSRIRRRAVPRLAIAGRRQRCAGRARARGRPRSPAQPVPHDRRGPHRQRRACHDAGGAFRHRGAATGDRLGARRQCAAPASGSGALGGRRSRTISTRASARPVGTTPICCSITRYGPALLQSRAGWYHRPLALGAMQRRRAVTARERTISRRFVRRNARPSRRSRRSTGSTIEREGDMLRFELHADAFLQHMVRNIVGSLVCVGCGRQPPRWLAEVLAGRDRSRAAPTFAAAGLYLTGVDYASAVESAGDARLCARRGTLNHERPANARENLRHHSRRRWHCRGARRRGRDRTRVLARNAALRGAGAGARDHRCAAALRDGRGLVRGSRAGRGARRAGRRAARSAAVPRRRSAGFLRKLRPSVHEGGSGQAGCRFVTLCGSIRRRERLVVRCVPAGRAARRHRYHVRLERYPCRTGCGH